MRFSFTVQVSGLSMDADHYENVLYDAGCDDALIAVVGEALFLDFDREASSFEDAVKSATFSIEKAGGRVTNVREITQ